MARVVNFDLSPSQIEAGVESPADEDGVHDSFSQLIAEQSRNGGLPDAFELHLLPELEEDGGASYLPSPGRGNRGRRREEREEDWDDCSRQTDTLLGERWSSDTLKVLSSMPSRTIGRSRGAIISQYYNRTMQLRRRRQSRPAIQDISRSARPSIRGYGVESDSTDAEGLEVSKKDHLVNNLQNLSVGDRIRMLREMPLSLSEKSELRRLASQKEQRSVSGSQIPCCSRLKYYIIIAARQSWYSWLSFMHALQLWQVALKRVSGRFGSGVLSYFLFLKTLLFLNVFLLVVTVAFLVLPQAVHMSLPPPNRLQFSSLELLTGAGYFTDTVMYYGFYSNYTLHSGCRDEDCASQRLSYNMPLAYFFTIGVALFVTCIILVYSMSKSFGQSFRIDKTHSILAMKVFSSWDFNVIKKTSVKLMSENICTQIKELLAEVNQKCVQKSVGQKLWRLTVHGLAWAICIGSTAGCVLAVYHLSHHMHQDHQLRSRTSKHQLKEASLLAVPVGVSFINLLLPVLFSAAAWMEEYESPSVGTYVAISRHLMLKVSVLGVLCYHWLARVAADPQSLSLQCWESFVGQELYRFLLMDFIFTLLDTLFGEFLWRLFCEKVLKKKRKPVFDIAKNVLELIYGQTLAWLGILFTPLLPTVQVLKLLLLFYIKKGSVMMNCQAPRTPYRVSQMTTIFITLLCFPSFLGASVCLTYTMWSIMPSASCGPFRGLKTMFQSGKLWMAQLEEDNPRLSVLARAHAYLVENPLFLFIGAGIFLIIIYFHSQVVDGQRKIISLLQEQIENEGKDKKFLITRLQTIHEQKRIPAQKLTSRDSAR
ncbi:transmembrane channel-like protein 6b [Thalassophryne amazonica]|uniref:transmembrane channel-like protein 6b n=1 Tax=Thalassophryne amazonica TaxID=390379 RepID=UPI0014713EAF|nr:transmembrane channel-like protein 6b [Thalassophryne amazonica]